MFVATFYSYKGGVGRTLALANTAFRLAARGKRVFILDFDLEAPGLDAFRSMGDVKGRPGIVEYISAFAQQRKVDPLHEYVSEIDPSQTNPGKVFFMSAGKKDKRYQHLLSRLDWKMLYSQKRGFLFVENLKATIEKEYEPDYVLVDSRTGLTDISGICTLQLPNLVVLLFNLNNQNIAGISQIYRSIRFNKLQRDIKTLLVASPIPDVPDYIGLRKERLDYARKTIRADSIDLVLPFDAFVAFEEVILSSEEPKTYLSRSYDSLCEGVIAANKHDVLTMLDEIKRLVKQGNFQLADLRFQELIDANAGDHRACLEYGRFLRMRGKVKEAVDFLKKALELNPSSATAVEQLVTAHLDLGEAKEASHYLDTFLQLSSSSEEIVNIGDAFQYRGAIEEARKSYQRAIEVKETVGAHLVLGNVHMRMGRPELAIPHYKRGIELAPADLPSLYNCGYALNLVNDPSAAEYFKKAIELFEQSDLSSVSSSMLANQYQAMSHAYTGIGQTKRGREALEKALEAARRMEPNRTIFSSVQYRYIPAKHFVEETVLLIKKTQRN